MRPRSDAELLQCFTATRDDDAFAALVERHGRLVLRLCRHLLDQEQDAEDCFQATFVLLAQKAGTLRKGCSVGSWLYGVAHRVAMNAKRKAARRRRHEQQAAHARPAKVPSEVGLRELQAVLDDEVARLPEIYRTAFLLCAVEGKSGAAAAGALGCKEGTVKARLSRARQLLQRRLARRGVTLSAALCAGALATEATSAAVPSSLTAITTQAALLAARGQSTAGVLSATAAALVKAVNRALLLSKVKTAAASLALVVASVGVAALSHEVFAQRRAPAEQPAPAVREKSHVDLFGDPLPAGALARLGTVRFRQGDLLTALCYSGDGKLLASAGDDGIVRLWDAATGRELRQFRRHARRVFSLSFAADGKTVVSGDEEGKVWLWETATGKDLRSLGQRLGCAYAVALAPDGKTVAVANGNIHLFEATTGTELDRFEQDPAGPFPVTGIAFSPDGKTLASWFGGRFDPARLPRVIRLWDVATGKRRRELTGHEALLSAVAYSPQGKVIASGDQDGMIRLWEPDTGKELRHWKGHGKLPAPSDLPVVVCLAFSPCGQTLASCGLDGTIRFWDVANGKQTRRIVPRYFVSHLAFSSDGDTLATGENGGVIRLWDLKTAQERPRSPGHENAVMSFAYLPDGKTLASWSLDRRTARFWDVTSGKQLRQFLGPPVQHSCAEFSPDRKTLAWGSWQGRIHLWSTAEGKELRQLEGHPNGTYCLAFSADGKTLASSGADGMIRLWQADTGKLLAEFSHGRDSPVMCLAFSPDGQLLADGCQDNSIWLRDAATGKRLRALQGHNGVIFSLAFSPDGRSLASASNDKTVRLWEVATGKERRLFQGHRREVTSVAFSPDGKLLASGSYDKTVRLWDLATAKPRHDFVGHRGAVYRVAFSPDGNTLTSAGRDTTLLVWDVAGTPGVGR
jgi:RNA polymerase sigma factor (sigma-70 family)